MPVTKSREATELRAKAKVLIDKIGDPEAKFTAEEFAATKKEYDTLMARSNMLAEFTPE